MGIFEGIKVLDVASFIAAPAAATILADFGADVIKIEPPGEGDPYRALPLIPNLPKAEHNYAWSLVSRGKRDLALDLKTDEGRAVLYKLVESADVLITNFPRQVRSKLGLDYGQVSALNPRLIYASMTGYGETGPEADKPGFDAHAYWARSGLADAVRAHAGALPAAPALGMGDQPTAGMFYAAIVTALFRRERTGQGAWVTTSLLANGVWANGPSIQAALCGGEVPYRLPRDQARNALTLFYRCRDERWFMISLVAEDRQWPRLAEVLEIGHLVGDARFATVADRRANAQALIAELDRAFAGRDSAEWQRVFEAGGLTVGIVARTEDAVHDEQMRLCGALVPAQDIPHTGLTVDSPFWIAGESKAVPRQAPSLGEHSDEVLREHDFSAEQIAALRERGVVA